MKNLITPTGLHIAGQWLQPGDRVPGDVVGFDYEKAERKGLIEDTEGDDIENLPLPGQERQLEAAPYVDTDLLEAARADAAENGRLLRASRELQGQAEAAAREAQAEASTLKGEIERLKGEQAGREEEWTKQRDGLLTDLADALKREDALKASALPEDALKRITDVKGVGDKLAPVILAALKAPATPALAPQS